MRTIRTQEEPPTTGLHGTTPPKMIYLATYQHKKHRVQQADYTSKRLIFITAEDRLTLDKVIALIKKLTHGDLEESSVEIIGQRRYDPKTISNPLVKFYRVD